MWCPVCALTAVISGEQHPMLDVVAEHSVALLTLVKAMLDNFDSAGMPPQPPSAAPEDPTEASEPGPTDAAEPGPTDAAGPGPTDSAEPGRYQHIRVIVDE
jgi:hypothetical protein